MTALDLCAASNDDPRRSGSMTISRSLDFAQVETAFKQVIHVRTAAQLAAARGLLVTARRQLYRLLADDAE